MGDNEHVRIGVTTLLVPPRAKGMASGKEIAARIKEILGDPTKTSGPELLKRQAEVEELIYAEFRKGNVPDFMRPENFTSITLQKTIDGRKISITIRACVDYMAVGSNGDYLIVPVSALLAQRLADQFGFTMPTQKIVDVIDDESKRVGGYLPFYAAPILAEKIINPHTGKSVLAGEAGQSWNFKSYGFYEGRWMESGQFVEEQNRRIYEAWTGAGSPGGIRSGHKKDVIYDAQNYMQSNEGGQPVVIYHKGIQGLSNVHKVDYKDYSHGVRFLSDSVELTITEKDGRVTKETRTYASILNDPKLYQVLSYSRVDITKLYRGINFHLEPPPKRPEKAVLR